MNKIASLALLMGLINLCAFSQLPYLKYQNGDTIVDKELYREYLNSHPFSTRKPLLKEDIKKMDKKDRPDLAYEHDWLMTHDPKTGKIEWQRLIPVINQLHQNNQVKTTAPGGSASNKWVERGPNNIGGRTRAIMFDPTDNTNKRVYAGGVGGGLWKNNDITNSNSAWTSVNDFWANIAVSAMAYDPTSTSTWYVATGEGFGNADAIRGAGIWKSTNAGTSWTQLSATSPASTSSYRYIMDLVVTSTGRIVVAASGGLYTSDNGGTSFTRRINSSYFADIEIAANGDLYAGTRYSGRLYKSTDNGTNWTLLTNLGGSPNRIEIACAPSDSNTVYAVASGGSGSNDIEWFKKSTNGGNSWSNVTIPIYASSSSTHFTRRQAWYDLILWVHPTNKNLVVAGGVDLHRTTNGGSTWSPVSYWNTSQFPLPEVHADQHIIVSRPGNNNEVVIGNDGGVYYSSNLGNASTSRPTFSHRVKNYNVTQFYSAAIHPGAGSDTLLAGAQDNGSLRSVSSGLGSWSERTGGDGAFCFIDQNNSNVFITSYVYNNWRRSLNGGGSFNYLPTDNSGRFINPSDYDDNLNILYAAKNSTTIKRISNLTGSYSVQDVSVSNLGGTPTHIRVSPYTTTSSTLFVGSGQDVYKITNANSTPSGTKITGSTFPAENISCIEIGASENELLVTFYSYGGREVYYTSNGGTSWVDKSGNLPDMPIRWALFNPKNRKEVIIATEVGVWSTNDITVASPVWTASNLGLANTRVDMLQYRSSDSLIMASTHGRGAFTGRFKSAITVTPPTASFTASKSTICVGESVTYRSTSTGNPSSYQWTVNGGTPSSGGIDSIVVSYSTAGTKSVKLVVSNAGGSDSVTQSLVTVVAAPNATLSTIGPFCTNSSSISLTNGSPSGGTYSGTGVSGSTFSPSMAGVGNHTLKYVVSNSNGCKDSATTMVTVNTAPNATLGGIGPFCTTDPIQTLTQGSPSGGVYSGTGISGNTFSPSMAGAGSHTIKYVVSNSNGCKDSATTTVVVSSGSSASASSVPNQCSNGAPITLNNATPLGGTYSGTGVSSGMFNPVSAGVGTHTIKYVVGSGSCKDSTTFTIQVVAAPNATLGGIGPFCTTDPIQTLTQGSPSGGVYSGTGVSGNTFSPSMAGAGSHTIKYVVSNSNGCKDSATTTVVVGSGSSASASSVPNQCSNGAPITLNNATPLGGTYSGTGVSSGMFNPVSAGVGTHTIKYVVGSGSCKDSTTFTIQVVAAPNATLGGIGPFCTTDPIQTLTQGSPSGGVYSGTGVSGNTFSPSMAGAGSHTIKYVVSNSNGCKDSATTTVSVNAGTSPTLGSFSDMCEDDSPLTLSGGTPTGGTYSGTGVSAGVFNPSTAGAGIHTISYTHANACGKSATSTIKVIAKPNVSTSGDTSVCMGKSVRLLATGATSYSWSPSSTLSGANTSTPLATPTSSTTYTVVGTDSGCTARSSLVVTVNPLPTISAGVDDTACSGIPYQLVASGGVSYLWSPSTGLSANNISSPIATLTASQLYSVVGTDAKGCSNSDSVFIAVKANPTATLMNIGNICESDGAFTLTQGSPLGGIYTGQAVAGGKFFPSRVGAGVTKVYYSVTDGNCVGMDSVQVTVIGSANISWLTALKFCENDTAISPKATPSGGVFSGNALSGGKIDPPVLGMGTFNIEYEYTDNDGCKTIDKQELVINPSDSIGSIQGVFRAIVNRSYNYHVAALNGASYHWTLTGGRFQAKNNNSVTVKWGSGPKGVLKVVQTNIYGCMDSTEVDLGVDPLSEKEYVLGKAVLKLYPNPSSSNVQVYISGIGQEQVNYTVLDLSGKAMASGIMEITGSDAYASINVSEFENGLFFFSVETNDESLVVPMLVNH